MTRNAVGEQSLLLCIQHTCPSKFGCSCMYSMYVVFGYSWLSQGTRFYYHPCENNFNSCDKCKYITNPLLQCSVKSTIQSSVVVACCPSLDSRVQVSRQNYYYKGGVTPTAVEIYSD